MTIKYFTRESEPTLVIHLRLPAGLSDKIRDYADKHEVSINRAVVQLLMQAIGYKFGGRH